MRRIDGDIAAELADHLACSDPIEVTAYSPVSNVRGDMPRVVATLTGDASVYDGDRANEAVIYMTGADRTVYRVTVKVERERVPCSSCPDGSCMLCDDNGMVPVDTT